MLPINNIVEAIRKSNPENIHQFRFGLGTIYHMSNMKDFFPEDLKPLKKFRQEIDDIAFENNPILCKMALDLLKNQIDKIIDVLSEDCTS